jgi:hypothetical protein
VVVVGSWVGWRAAIDTKLRTELLGVAKAFQACSNCCISSHTCNRSNSVVVGFVDSDLGAGATINCLASCSTATTSVTRQCSSATSRLLAQVEVDNIQSILSVIEGPWCSWGVELDGEPRRVSGALG